MGVPRLPDYATLEQMLIGSCKGWSPKECIKRLLRINDEQIAVNRYNWYNLPRGITGNMIERMLYFRGSVAWFAIGDQFYVLPYCLNGTIDLLGRFQSISPLPFTGKSETEDDSKDPRAKILSDIKANVLWDPVDFEDVTPELIKNSAVILTDYTRQLPQMVLPKYKLVDGVIDLEAEMYPYARTALMNATGVSGVRVEDQNQAPQVDEASKTVQKAALDGRKWVAIQNPLEIQELAGGQVAKAEEYLLVMQSLDNFRLGVYGVENGGLFEKRAHTTDLENSINMGTSSFALEDGLYNRQQWADIINSYTGFGIWCEPKEVAAGADLNMDGMIGEGDDEMMQGEPGATEGGMNNAG